MKLEKWKREFLDRITETSSPHTLRAYRRDLEDLLAFLDEHPGKLDHRRLRAYLATLKARGLKSASVARKLATVRSFFRFLVREQVLKSNPAVALRTPRHSRPLPLHLAESDVEQLISAAENTLGRKT